MAIDRTSYRVLQWLVFACFALHNLEEGLTVASYLPRAREILSQYLSPDLVIKLPRTDQFYYSLIGVTLLPLVLTVIATTGNPSPFKPYLVAGIAAVMLLNVFVPHLPAAFLLGGYAPGLFTAVGLNLPFSIYFLSRSLREGHVTRMGLVKLMIIAAAVLLLGLSIVWMNSGQ
jgi:hypothetical protein